MEEVDVLDDSDAESDRLGVAAEIEALEPDDYLCESDEDDDAMLRYSTVAADAAAALQWTASHEGLHWIQRVQDAVRTQREQEERDQAAAQREREKAAQLLHARRVWLNVTLSIIL
jgi:hypothetical protein